MKPLVVFDTSCVMHKTIDLTRNKQGQIVTKLTNGDRDARIKAGIALYNTLFWFKGANPANYDVIWVGDDKTEPYWRRLAVSNWLAGLDPMDKIFTKRKGARLGYKGSRASCPYQTWVSRQMNRYSACLTVPGYEADDIIAGIVKTVLDRDIIIMTVDSDLIQLVDERVSWCCLTGFNPSFRDVEGSQKWFANKLSKESKKTQAAIDPTNLRDIVKWKSLVGDISDNLPAGTPEYIIDLFNPPEGHRLWEEDYFAPTIAKYIDPAVDNLDLWEQWAFTYGLPTTADILLPVRLLY